MSPGDAVPAPVKGVPTTATATMPINRAISTAGSIAWSELAEHVMLHRVPGTLVVGEILDWEAPTGGYLLQASFSTGVVAARGALAWLGAIVERWQAPAERPTRPTTQRLAVGTGPLPMPVRYYDAGGVGLP